MSLDIDLMFPVNTGNGIKNISVYEANITHNLNTMAMEAGIYYPIWHKSSHSKEENPNEYVELEKAQDLIPYLENGISSMSKHPNVYKKFDSPNGWGVYNDFLPWLEDLLNACKEYPLADIRVFL